MTTPPKRQTFAEEMELLKKQKAQAAQEARQRAAAQAQARVQQAQRPPEPLTSSPVTTTSSSGDISLPPELAHMLARGKAPAPAPVGAVDIVLPPELAHTLTRGKVPAAIPRPAPKPVVAPTVPVASQKVGSPGADLQDPVMPILAQAVVSAPSVQAIVQPAPAQVADPKPARLSPLTEDEATRLAREKAMAIAFAKHAPKGEGPNSARRTQANEKYTGDMLFCTTCRCATAGEYRLPPGEGFGALLDTLGLQYFRRRDPKASRQCTRCCSEDLVPMGSDVARTLCGDAYDGVMASGWAEMRRAEQVHTMERKIAIGKVMVVGVVLMGASLYAMSSPSSSVREARTQEMRQKLHAQEIERKAQSEEQDEE